MSDPAWTRVEALFHEALARPVAERSVFVEREAAGDLHLAREVMSLLRAAGGAEDALAEAVGDAITSCAVEGEAVPSDGRLGAYRIEKQIGRGGMGTVYLAARADDQYRQRVAVKVLRLGLGSDLATRFRQERQILANLDHPNIARLLDGGVDEEGRPYLVMEYVEGRSLTAYCDEERLGLSGRLRLFRSVCSAVHHAHRQLVVHRDLKPANVLVTADGVPKLLDFGIAKVLLPEDAPAVTGTGLRPLTPLYASPEQLRGEALGTSSDVYSLGVILYELLSGQRPFEARARSLAELARAVCDDEPVPPSAAVVGAEGAVSQARGLRPERLRRELAGDLDTITLKAIRKEPGRRYASADQLAEDVERYLEGRPVRARPDTLGYRTGKFLRRHRVSSLVAVLALLAVGASLAAAWRQARLAERRFQAVRTLAHTLLFDFHDAVAKLPGSTAARELVVRKGLEHLDRLSQEAGDDPGLQRELAAGYDRVGWLQGGPTTANLGDLAGARASYEKAVALFAAADRRSRPDAADVRRRASALRGLATVRIHGGDTSALSLFTEAIQIMDGVERSAADSAHHELLGEILSQRGQYHAGTGQREAALADYERALRELTPAAGATASRTMRGNTALIRDRQGALRHDAGDVRGALADYEAARDLLQAMARENPNDMRVQRTLCAVHLSLGDVSGNPYFASLSDTGRALEEYGEALRIATALVAADAKNAVARRDMELATVRIGEVLLDRGDLAGARTRLEEGHRMAVALADSNPAYLTLGGDVAESCERLGDLERLAGNGRASQERYRRAVEHWDALRAREPDGIRFRAGLARASLRLGEAWLSLSQPEKARPVLANAASLAEALRAAEPDQPSHRIWLAAAHGRLADVAEQGVSAGGGRREACRLYALALQEVQGLTPAAVKGEQREKLPDELRRALARCP